jgi:integrase
MARRGNNEGTISKRVDGRWEARVSLPNGKRKCFYGKTREEVRKQMQEALHDAQKGVLPADGRQTVKQYLEYWLDLRKQTQKIGISTVRTYYYHIHRILPHIGQTLMMKLSAQQIQRMYLTMLGEGIASTTLFYTHNMLRAAMNDAVRQGVIQKSVLVAVTAPKNSNKEMQVLRPDQVQIFIKGIQGHRDEALYNLVLSTGLRAGEVFALQWHDIDFERRILTVRQGWHQEMKGYSMSLPKTPHSRRTIALSQRVIQLLLKHREQQEKEKEMVGERWQKEYNLIFPSTVGGRMMLERVCSYHLRPLLRNLGLPEIRFHDLRHTAATLLLGQGVNVKVVSEMLGHANVTTTLRTYAHVLPHMQEHAVQIMEDILTGG